MHLIIYHMLPSILGAKHKRLRHIFSPEDFSIKEGRVSFLSVVENQLSNVTYHEASINCSAKSFGVNSGTVYK